MLTFFTRLALLPAAIAAAPISPPSAYAQDGLRQQAEWNRAVQQALDEAGAELRSDKPNEVAWGAFRAAEYRLFNLMPDLIAKLAAPPAGDDREVYAVRAALLDSAVRLDAAVPASVVRSYWNDFPVQSAILFARATGARDAVLLDLLTSAIEFRWFALANLLVQWRPSGLAVSPNALAVNILTPIHLNLVVTVSEQGNAGSGGGAGGGVGDGIGMNPAGFPPRATYRFESGPLPGLTVLSTGPRVVYYSRTVSYGWQFGVSEAYIGGPTGAERLRYVQAYAFPEHEPFDRVQQLAERNEVARWEGDDALRRRVDDLRADMLQKYRDFLTTLVTRGRLTAADAQSLAQPPIDVRIVDARKDKSQPLPVIK
jgi:hypothetical protein